MYLGIDVGTGTLKAAIVGDDGAVVAAAEESYDLPMSLAVRADFDPAIWWAVCQRVVRRVTVEHGSEVEAVGVAGQMHGVVLVDAEGRPVRDAVLWPDHRAEDVLEDFTRFDADHPGVLGNPIVPGMAGPILAWLARHEAASVRAADRVVQPKDWLRLQLCGLPATTDPSDASATLLYDLTTNDWSDAVCAALGIDRSLLPALHPSNGVSGAISRAVAEDLNLPQRPVVVVGAGDAAAALLGAGIEEPGIALINIGTGGQIMTPIPAPSRDRRLGPGIHQYRSASEITSWYAMAAVANAGLALGWVREIVGYDWEEMYATAADVLTAPDQDPLFLPFLSGEREPSRDDLRGGVWSGLTLAHDRKALARSALRGVAFYLGLRARALMDLTDVSTAVMSGGSARHPEWVEALATVLGVSLTVAPDAHLTVRGAARLAARGLGTDLPNPPPGYTVHPDPAADVAGRLEAFEAAVTSHF